MEEAVPEPEPRAMLDNEDTSGVLAQENEKKMEEKEVMKEECKTRKEQEKQSQQRLVEQKRRLADLLVNAQTEADAKVVQKRTQLQKAKEKRAELLENDVKSSQEKFDEIERRWLLISQKESLPDLWEAINEQQELRAVPLQDKKKFVNKFQQELKLGDDCYVKDLRKNAEEIDQWIERMEDQTKILTQAYMEEMAQIERVHEQELQSLLSEDMIKEDLKEMWDKEEGVIRNTQLERFSEGRKKAKEFEERSHELRFQNQNAFIIVASKLDNMAKEQAQKRIQEKNNNARVLRTLPDHIKNEAELTEISLTNHQRKKLREMYKVKEKRMKEQQELAKQRRARAAENKRSNQMYERIKVQIKHFPVADARKYEEMQLMIYADLKQLAERALLIDSVISSHLLGLPWEKPPLDFVELPHPRRSQQPASDSGSGPEREEEDFLSETQKKVKELLCHETDFLMETNVLKLLAPLENEEQTNVKLATLVYSLGLDNNDLRELTDFLLKYEQQQREQNKDACAESRDLAEAAESRATTSSASELINPNNVLPALKSFLKRTRRSSAPQQDSSEDEAHWESLGNLVSEEKLQLWDTAERILKEYHAVLTDFSDLTLETDRLKQRNSELRMQLQQRLASTDDSLCAPYFTSIRVTAGFKGGAREICQQKLFQNN